MKWIRAYQPEFTLKEVEGVKKIMRKGTLTAGNQVDKFEKRFAEYIGAPYVVAVNSCSSAMFLSLLYRKKTKEIGRRVFIPSVTHTSVANSIVNAGLKVGFMDEVYVGHSYPLLRAQVVDSAHELHRNCFNKMKSFLVCYSFYPTKPLGGAEGGAIATRNIKEYSWLKRASRLGIEAGASSWEYKVAFPGWKMHMNDIQAVILNGRLGKLKANNIKRKRIVNRYNKALGVDNSSLHVYPIFVKGRKKFIDDMRRKLIECSVHFQPLHLQPAYTSDESLPKSERWGKDEVSLPLHENMSYADADRVIKEVENVGSLI